MRIAQVGAFNPLSKEDQARYLLTLKKIDVTITYLENDIINLLYDRDFIKENHHYDLVLLHCIFHPLHPVIPKNMKDPFHMISDLDNIENWRHRLLCSSAKYISVFDGRPPCLNGRVLGKLQGYEKITVNDLMILYKKLS